MTLASTSADTMVVLSDALNLEKDTARKHRMETWRLTIEQELQSLITQAADMRKTINEAQTSVKKKYYTKKFKKISEQVVQLLAIQSQLPPREQPDSPTATPSVTDETSTNE